MNKILLSLATAITFSTAGGGCLLTQSNSVDVTWKAYKTLAKLGVAGKFTGVTYKPTKLEGKNFKELLVGSNIFIDLHSVNTRNDARDKTLVNEFFDNLKGKSIDGEIVSIQADEGKGGKRLYSGTIEVKIIMNGKSRQIPMRYSYKNELFKAEGTIDIFDFSGQSALEALNKSCYDLHKGKTWNDVTIGFSIEIKAKNCDAELDKKKK